MLSSLSELSESTFIDLLIRAPQPEVLFTQKAEKKKASSLQHPSFAIYELCLFLADMHSSDSERDSARERGIQRGIQREGFRERERFRERRKESLFCLLWRKS